MIKAKTGKGTTVFLALIPDVGPNKGGYYVEIYLGRYSDRLDDFCIHPEDCDCTDTDKVEKYAKEYVLTIKEY